MNDELRTFARSALHRHGSVVGFNDGLDQTQAQAEAALGPALVAAIKPLPNARLLVQWNPHAGVANPHSDATGFNGADEADVATIGQYLQPTRRNLPVSRYVTPPEFDAYRDFGLSLGFKKVFSGPLVRSSYMADLVSEEARHCA